MGSHVARDDLASLFNDDLLGMESGVGDAAAEEKAREALSNSFFQDESRGTPDRAGGRGGGGRETRGYDSPPPPGMHAGGCTPGGGVSYAPDPSGNLAWPSRGNVAWVNECERRETPRW